MIHSNLNPQTNMGSVDFAGSMETVGRELISIISSFRMSAIQMLGNEAGNDFFNYIIDQAVNNSKTTIVSTTPPPNFGKDDDNE